jgi:hypothetical protein
VPALVSPAALPKAGRCVLRLDADAWVLASPAGVRRRPLDGAPALQLEHLEFDAAAARARRLQVVIGDGWLRYLVARWPQRLRRGDERRAWLAHRFREVHGVAEPEWTIATDRDAVGVPVLAGAVPAALVGAVQAFAERRRLRLDGVAGDFVVCFNRHRRSFDEPAGSFGALALARDGRVTVGLWRDAAWLALRSQPFGDDGAGMVVRTLEGWCAAHAAESVRGGRERAGPADTASGAQRSAQSPAGVLYAVGFDASAPAGWRVERRRGSGWD